MGLQSECVHTMCSFTLTGAGVDYYYSWPVYESLFKPNAEGSVDPWLLESYEMDKDSLTYTFHIRKGVTFSDGTVLDAEAVKWNLDHYLPASHRRPSSHHGPQNAWIHRSSIRSLQTDQCRMDSHHSTPHRAPGRNG
mgnify:CR=1 FL=1